MALTVLVALLTITPLVFLAFFRLSLLFLGRYLTIQSRDRRDILRALFKRDLDLGSDEKVVEVDNGWEKVESSARRNGNNEWSGIIGFFHPFCNAGGGGERVLWAAIEATQKRYPNAICAVYTGDHEIERATLIETVKKRFDIALQFHSLQFVYLNTRHLVLASTWPRFTLLGQSLGSVVLAYDAFSMLVPDIFIDTIGYAFAVAFCKYLFSIPTAAYVHYPTISTDMLESLDDTTGTKGVNAGAGVGTRGKAKKLYWRAFAYLYGWAGRTVDLVMCNSTWTANHIRHLWKPKKPSIVYPPCPVHEIASNITLSDDRKKDDRNPTILYVAQFRPEKNHAMILNAFAKFFHAHSGSSAFANTTSPRLVLIGSVRANTPDEKHIYSLRLLAHELKITKNTTFITDAPFALILQHLQTSSIGVNGMYAEHFGIGNVEGLAAGLIPVVHNSGGPKEDIVIPYEGSEIGFRCENEAEYTRAFGKVLTGMSDQERIKMRQNCRKSAERFTGEVFEQAWLRELDVLVNMQGRKTKKS